MKRYILIHITLLTALLLPVSIYGSKQKDPDRYSGTYSTQAIRILWMGCWQGANQKNASNTDTNGVVCDCIMDKTRKRFTYQYIKFAPSGEMQSKYAGMAEECTNEIINRSIEESI